MVIEAGHVAARLQSMQQQVQALRAAALQRAALDAAVKELRAPKTWRTTSGIDAKMWLSKPKIFSGDAIERLLDSDTTP